MTTCEDKEPHKKEPIRKEVASEISNRQGKKKKNRGKNNTVSLDITE